MLKWIQETAAVWHQPVLSAWPGRSLGVAVSTAGNLLKDQRSGGANPDVLPQAIFASRTHSQRGPRETDAQVALISPE
jgi:hypothetical protein